MKTPIAIIVAAALGTAWGCGDSEDASEPAASKADEASQEQAEASQERAEAQQDEAEPAPADEEPRKLLAVGAEAPTIEAEAHNGETIDLDELRGQKVVMYFYPKDETPG